MSTDNGADNRAERGAPPADISEAPAVVAPPMVSPATAVVALPKAGPATQRTPGPRRWVKPALLLLLLVVAAAGGAYYWLRPRPGLPPGIASGNGRLEADEIDIDTKLAGRIATLFADEGDLTKAGEVLVKMDTQDLEASLKQDQALIVQAQQALAAARASVDQQRSQELFAQQEIARTETLVPKGAATQETLDQQRQALVSATAAEHAAEAVIGEEQAALDAATHAAEVVQADINDDSLVSPRDGRIEYRVANVGEVLPAGGKVFTILDTSYLYMDIYLPTLSAGRVELGSDARIVLDAYPDHAFPAKVVFVAAQAQFTPKTVETKDERDVLMFRVRVRINPEELVGHAAEVRSGLPGMAYVLTDRQTAWPPALQGEPRK